MSSVDSAGVNRTTLYGFSKSVIITSRIIRVQTCESVDEAHPYLVDSGDHIVVSCACKPNLCDENQDA